MKEFNITELSVVANEILGKAKDAPKDTATVIALSGELGAGKTTTTQEIARLLGVKENIISPTFVIVKKYPIHNISYEWKNLVHIDAYRLNHSDELKKLGWQELLEDKNNLIIVEWPERVSECLNEGNICRISLAHHSTEGRTIEFT